jgi:porin
MPAMQRKFQTVAERKAAVPVASSCATFVRKTFVRAGALRLGMAVAIFAFAIIRADAQQLCGSPPLQAPQASGQDAAPKEQRFPTDLFASSRTNLLGDIGGLRPMLDKYGLTFGLQDSNEVFGNVSGGIKRGANYDGLTQMCLSLNTKRAFGWEGGIAYISALQIRGRDLSATNLSDLQIYSGTAAEPSTRLWELWYQQTFLGGKMDVKVGQQSLDQEFMTSQQSNLFINAMMGWPMLPTADMYGGGPAYPLSSAGVRLRAQPVDPLTLLAGVFQDNPPGGPFNDDPQLRGSSAWGGNFLNLATTGALFIAEAQYAVNQAPDPNHPEGLPGTYKLGAWFDTAAFPNQRYATDGLSLADPMSTGVAQMEQTNFSIYGVVDQTIWRASGGSQQALGVFTRVMAAPDDRNLISFSANGGATLNAPLQGRDKDTLGLGFGVARVSSFASALAQDTAFYTSTSMPIRSTETFIEATYQCQVTPWWQLQPDFQYVFRPGGGIPDPDNPSIRVGDEAIFGLRSVVTF